MENKNISVKQNTKLDGWEFVKYLEINNYESYHQKNEIIIILY